MHSHGNLLLALCIILSIGGTILVIREDDSRVGIGLIGVAIAGCLAHFALMK